MIRDAAAAVAGLVVAFLLVYAVQFLGHSLYPPPAGLDQTNLEAMQDYVSTLPIPALLFPMFAYFIGTFCGTLLAGTIGTARPVIFAFIVGLLILAGTIANLIWIPHPLWFSIAAVLGIIGSAWLAMTIAGVKRPVSDE